MCGNRFFSCLLQPKKATKLQKQIDFFITNENKKNGEGRIRIRVMEKKGRGIIIFWGRDSKGGDAPLFKMKHRYRFKTSVIWQRRVDNGLIYIQGVLTYSIRICRLSIEKFGDFGNSEHVAHERKWIFSQRKIQFVTSFDLIKCLYHIKW